MKIRLINFGGKAPQRAHYNDAGADVFASIKDWHSQIVAKPGQITKVPLGVGLELPDGFVAFVLPRSGMSANKGITTEVVPIDSGYRGEIHAIVHNASTTDYVIKDGDKIAQLVIVPTVLATFTFNNEKERDEAAFGSTGY